MTNHVRYPTRRFEKIIVGTKILFVGIYFHKELKTCDDVCQYLMEKLGDKSLDLFKDFHVYNVDAYWLLNMVDYQNLEKYGIKDNELRKKVLQEVEKLKAQCSIRYPVGK